MARVMNFGAGPGTLPLAALERAKGDLLDFDGTGMGICEHSHRGKAYSALHAETKALLTSLLGLDESWEMLLLQGGASAQFAQIPMNFLGPEARADYVLTGTWGEHALAEARRMVGGRARVAGTSGTGPGAATHNGAGYNRVVRPEEVTVDPGASYVHCTSNETVHGVQFGHEPGRWFDAGSVPVVCDVSSDFLAAPTDLAPFSLVYAGAQKNLGPSGLVVVLVRKEFLARAMTNLPNIFSYAVQAKNDSLYNTPATLSVYLARNVLAWVRDLGGLPAMEARNHGKATALYAAIDRAAEFYRAPVEKSSRSVMNAVFRLPTEALENAFVSAAEKEGMFGLKGHRSVGGIRVSMYNAVEPAWISALAAFMDDFARKAG